MGDDNNTSVERNVPRVEVIPFETVSVLGRGCPHPRSYSVSPK